jgi:hypothetical protein
LLCGLGATTADSLACLMRNQPAVAPCPFVADNHAVWQQSQGCDNKCYLSQFKSVLVLQWAICGRCGHIVGKDQHLLREYTAPARPSALPSFFSPPRAPHSRPVLPVRSARPHHTRLPPAVPPRGRQLGGRFIALQPLRSHQAPRGARRRCRLRNRLRRRGGHGWDGRHVRVRGEGRLLPL